jgi:hypothetical protein
MCNTVDLPFILKSILRQKKNYWNPYSSPCRNIILRKSSKRNQNPSRYYNSTSLNPVPNAQVCVYLTVHITKPDMKYKFFRQLSILMVTQWKSNVEIWQSFTIFFTSLLAFETLQIISFLNFWIFHFTFHRNFSGKNNGIKGLSGRICHRGPIP